MDAHENYLRLVGAYGDYLGGLRWSSVEDALEYPDGETFALVEEVALFLEGFTHVGPLVHFGHVLHLLDLLRGSRRTITEETVRLRQAFADGGRSLRNAGAFCAVLCGQVPPVPGPVDVRQVCARLRNPHRPIRWFVATFHDTFYPADQPPLGPAAFEQEVLRALRAYTTEELRDWLRHGHGPVKEAAAEVARQLALPRPHTLGGMLAELLLRPRLAGAQPFVAQLVSALTLPAPRLGRQDLPMGGYAEVATKGTPDRILPSQFALDEWDFFRRFAEHELLYFQREEPHALVRRELVVLLDQGVRTWGEVRLVLAAAVLAFGRQAERHKLALRLATTASEGELIDPLAVDSGALGELVEASDLSANPGLALERVLEQPADGARDVVLLTHARNLREPDVAAAARRVQEATRLFTVSLDGPLNVELAEVKRGVPVALRQLRLDVSHPPKPPREEGPLDGLRPWQGDVEPIGFPFCFGTAGSTLMGLADLDDAGDWLLTGGPRGVLHAWKTDGSRMEVLPRAVHQGSVLASLKVVLGVVGGFVVAGQIGDRLVAAHYELARRHCRVYLLGAAGEGSWYWSYVRGQHTVIAFVDANRQYLLNLHTGASSSVHSVWPQPDSPPDPRLFLPRGTVRVSRGAQRSSGDEPVPVIDLDAETGRVLVRGMTPPWKPFTPLADGRPLLKGGQLMAAKGCGTTLAVFVSRLDGRDDTLYAFRGPEGTFLGEFPVDRRDADFILSVDGRLLCLRTNGIRCAVHDLLRPGQPPMLTRSGRFSPRLQLYLGPRWLYLRTGKHHFHLLRWDRGVLELGHGRAGFFQVMKGVLQPSPSDGVAGDSRKLPGLVRYDPERFTQAADHEVVAVADRFGQVAVLDRKQKLVAMFFVFREQVAAWLPDGTCYGPVALTGRASTPRALERIGQALLEASQRGKLTS